MHSSILGRIALAFCWLATCWLVAFPANGDALQCPPLTLAASAPEVPTRHARGLLWRISRSGAAPSYLFGTIHLGDAALVEVPAVVNEALDQSPRFVMEARLDADEMANWSRNMLSDEPGALRVALGNALFERAVALLPRYGIPDALALQLKPWAVYLTLSTPPESGGVPLDLVLAARAERAGKAVEGLETVAEQAGIVAGLPMDDQVALVRDAVCHYDTLQKDIQRTKALYLERDLGALAAMARRYEMNESPRYRRLLQQMLWDRNRRMVGRLESYLSTGGVFVAIGALHLPGSDGVLGLLEARGFAVDSVY